MSSPSIDLDMNLLSSPVPPPRARAGEDGGVGNNNIHSQSSFASTENDHNVNNNNCTEDINGNSNNVFQSTFDVNRRGGDDSHSFAATTMKGYEYHSSTSGNTKSNVTHESIMQTESTATTDNFNYNTNDNKDDERMVINGKPTQKYNDMTKMVESWREELYMMNVKNSIMLDDLVKLGADV